MYTNRNNSSQNHRISQRHKDYNGRGGGIASHVAAAGALPTSGGRGQVIRHSGVQRRPSDGMDRRNQKASRMRVKGSLQGMDMAFEGAPLPKRDFFLSRVKKETEDEVLKRYLIDKGIKGVEVKVVSNPNAKFKSYKLTADVEDKEKIMSADIWPKGVCIEKWKNRGHSREENEEANRNG